MSERQQRLGGRQRLQILLAVPASAGIAAAMALMLYFYGLPYNPLWWVVMAAILVGAVVVPIFCARAVEWVMEGYRQDRQG